MHRRKFIHLLSGLAATPLFKSVRGLAQAASPAATPPSTYPDGFSKLTQDYASFCAETENQRMFYAFRNGQIISERFNPEDYKASAYDPPQPNLSVSGGSHDGVPMISPVPGLQGDGPYKPTWESLLQYECPEWYRDVKFGIWNHWSPQCVPEDGDWYARNMYIQGQKQYQFHLEHYGSPTRFGYKDLCAQWTLLNWEASELMDLYVSAGAKFFVALANHHDGFDTWDSKFHPWNASKIGPHRDVIGTWAAEARKRNLRFGVTVHAARNWWWFQPSHGTDSSGPFGGQPYDGHLTLADGRGQWWEGFDPQRLYAPAHPLDALPDPSYVKDFYDRTRDLIDQHDPDLLYFDNTLLPLGWGGMNIAAYFYNHNLAVRGGKLEAILNVKDVPPNLYKSVVADIERGLTTDIQTYPWQSETCIGQWHYQRKLFDHDGEYGGYMPPAQVIHWMVDTVSKNGTFLLNVPGKPDGTIDQKERLILERIGAWFKINGEAIYGTRPWNVYGEGPHTIKAGSFQGHSIQQLDASDVRYTRNKSGTVVYAIVLGWPDHDLVLASFGARAAHGTVKVTNVEMLGSPEKIPFRQADDGLHINRPQQKAASDYAIAFRLNIA